RRQLHAAVAGWYEQAHAADLAPVYPILAHHWQAAEVPAKAAPYAALAGTQALRHGAYQEAVDFLTAALAQDGPPATPAARRRQGSWECQLGEAWNGLGRQDLSRGHLERAVALLGWPVPTTRNRRRALIGQVGRQVGHRLRPGGPRLVALAERAARQEAATAYQRLIQIAVLANDRPTALHALLCGLNLAETAGPSSVLAQLYSAIGVILGFLRLPALAGYYGRRAQRLLRRFPDPLTRIRVGMTGTIVDVQRGRLAPAQAHLHPAYRLAVQIGDERSQRETAFLLEWILHRTGHFRQVQAFHQTILERAWQSTDLQTETYLLALQIQCLLHLGAGAAATALLQQIPALLPAVTGPVEKSLLYSSLALGQLYEGTAAAAVPAAATAWRMLGTAAPTSPLQLDILSTCAEVYLAGWAAGTLARPAAARTVTAICRALGRYSQVFAPGRPAYYRYRGTAAWLAGHPLRARWAWQRSLAAARRLDMRYDAALAHYEIGRHATGDARPVHLARARGILAGLGATGDLARLAAVLAKPRPGRP
ncbi:MAG TPA: hypothetical protein VKY74_28155, partial [Chloroflexia bacterium]|nr:hypothetical protein [Chloroflexia bacterium]